MHKDIIIFFLEQIRLKLQLVDGEVKKSKVQAIMKHCNIASVVWDILCTSYAKY